MDNCQFGNLEQSFRHVLNWFLIADATNRLQMKTFKVSCQSICTWIFILSVRSTKTSKNRFFAQLGSRYIWAFLFRYAKFLNLKTLAIQAVCRTLFKYSQWRTRENIFKEHFGMPWWFRFVQNLDSLQKQGPMIQLLSKKMTPSSHLF